MNWKKLPGKIGIGVVIAVVVFVGLKTCMVAIWQSPPTVESYGHLGPSDSVFHLTFFPKNYAVLWYSDSSSPKRGCFEAILMRMRGAVYHHLAWRFWKSPGKPLSSDGIFGFRIFPDHTTPVRMEVEVLGRVDLSEKPCKPVLPNKSSNWVVPVVFKGKEGVYLNEKWFYRVGLEKEAEEVATFLLKRLLQQTKQGSRNEKGQR